VTQSIYSGRSRHHPYAHGESARLVQPAAIGFGSAPGTPVLTEVAASCTENATPTAQNKLRIDSGAWTDTCGYCGYAATFSASSGLFNIIRLETDIIKDDTLVIDGNFFTGIGISASFTITIFVQPFTFPADAGQPGFRFLGGAVDVDFIDANTIELTEAATYDYQGTPAWFQANFDDGDILHLVGTATHDGYFLIRIDPTNPARVIVPGGHGLATGIDTTTQLLSWYRRCDINDFVIKRQGVLYDFDFGNLNVANLWQDVGATIPVTAPNDPVRALTNNGIGSASGPPILVRDAASTGEIRWNPNGLLGLGSVIFDGTAWFTLAAPQEGFVDNVFSILLLARHNKELRDTALVNNIFSWDITAVDRMSFFFDNDIDPHKIGMHAVVGGRDAGVFDGQTRPTKPGIWSAIGIATNENPAGNTEIRQGISDANSLGTLSGAMPAPIPPDTANEDFFLGRIEGDSAADRFVGEIARMLIWDLESGSMIFPTFEDIIEPTLSAKLPFEQVPFIVTGKFFDLEFSDKVSLYTDDAGSVPVVSDGDTIGSIAARGGAIDASPPNVALFINSTAAERPTFRASGGPRDLPYASFRGTNINLTAASFTIINADTFGIFFGVVFRRMDPVPTAANSYIFRWQVRQEIFIEQTTGRIMVDAGNGAIEALPEAELGKWYLVYLCADSGGNVDDAVWGSPGPEDNSAQPLPLDTVTSSTIRIGDENESVVDIQSLFVYSADRPAAERQRLRDFYIRKLGFLPN